MSRTPLSGGGRPQRRTASPRTLALSASAAVAVVALAGCSSQDIPAVVGLDMPKPATRQAHLTYDLWQGSWLAAWLVGALVWGLILWAVVAYRKRSDTLPVQTRYNIPIELLYTVVPVLIIGVLFFFTARDESRLTALSDNPDNTVNVVGFRWNWTFNYLDDGVYDTGSPAQLPTLYLVKDKSVQFELTSPDVIHSFWVPAFLIKMDLIPGKVNRLQVTPDAVGTYAGRCAELCGVAHSRMLFTVKVVSQADYDAHMRQLKAQGQVGVAKTGRIDTSVTGDEQGRTVIGGSK